MYRLQFYLIYFYFILFDYIESLQKAKDNGDIYITQEDTFLQDTKKKMQTESTLLPDNSKLYLTTTTSVPENLNLINFDEVIATCNSSFYIPMHYYTAFNTTAQLPDLVDKTGMCFIRCLYEKSGLIENWKLNAKIIRANIWPAMGDTIEVCQKEGVKEENACVRTYAIAKCLTLRSLVDARNKPRNNTHAIIAYYYYSDYALATETFPQHLTQGRLIHSKKKCEMFLRVGPKTFNFSMQVLDI